LSFLKNPSKNQKRSGLGGGAGELDGRKDGNAKDTTYKKREKNQTKTTKKQREHKDEEGKEGKAKSLSLFPGKAAQGGRESPTKEAFQSFSL
jgi:hypothetical protein